MKSLRFAALALLVSCLSLASAEGQPITVLAYETEPFSYREDGGPAGLEYDILDFYSRSSGRPLEIRWVDGFDQIIPLLRNREGDVAAATMTITPEREEVVDFSASYFPVRVMLVEPEGETSESLQDLAGSTLATMRGTTYEELLRPIAGASFVYGETEAELFELVARGEADALAVDSAVAFSLLPEFPGLELGIPISEEQHYGFAVPEGSPLAEELTSHISQLKSSKIYYRLLEKYLGEEAVRVVQMSKGE